MPDADNLLYAENFQDLSDWLVHGFGLRTSHYPAGITTVHQIHSGIVIDAAGRTGERIAEADALISHEPGITVGVRTADCVPILLVDPVTRAVAAIHAGWRGTVEKICETAIESMRDRWNVRPETLRAAIGPAIGLCCFEVGPEVARRFGIEGTGTVHLDLAAENEAQLRSCGVTNLWQSRACTFCSSDRFFSYRREKDAAGRMLSFAGQLKSSAS